MRLLSRAGTTAWLVLACLGAPAAALAQAAWPDKPVRLIVGLAAGGPTDTIARVVARRLTDRLGQSFVVENRAGASGAIAAQQVVAAPADGYTMLWASSSITLLPSGGMRVKPLLAETRLSTMLRSGWPGTT